MSTREEHPIDEFFRSSLANSEADPPETVWAAIQASQRSQRWWPLWFRMNGILLLLIPAAAFVVYASWPDRNDSVGTIGDGETDRIAFAENSGGPGPSITPGGEFASLASPSTASVAIIDPSSEKDDAIEHRSNENGSGITIMKDVPASAQAFPGPTGENDPLLLSDQTRTNATAAAGSANGSMTADHSEDDSTKNSFAVKRNDRAGEDVTGSSDLFASYIVPLPIIRQNEGPNGEPLSIPEPSPYVLPNGEWIVSLTVGTSDVARDWRGTDRPLMKALNDAEAHTTTYAFGIQAGRRYRSGFGLATGVISERSEQRFAYTDRRTEVSQQVINYIVTLDSEVFVSDPDTIDHVTTFEKRYDGIDRKTLYRVPIEGYFHQAVGRSYYGLRAGASLEFTQVQQPHSLAYDPDEARIEVRSLSGAELRSRYPVVLSGSIGIDLGYHLAENWSVELSPMYMPGILPITATQDVWAAPSRLALQFRLNHHFTTKHRK